jgi:hypothetical protein
VSARSLDDRFAAARAVADAVLYEGYVLYPYRASARKNQLRWQFGVLVPPACHRSDPSERSTARTECLVDLSPSGAGVVAADTSAGQDARLTVRIRCLQLQHRTVEPVDPAGPAGADPGGWAEPPAPWDEAVEHTVDLPPLPLPADRLHTSTTTFRLAPGTGSEAVPGEGGELVRVVRRREEVDGQVHVSSEPVEGAPGLVRVAVTVQNTQDVDAAVARGPRDEMVRRSLVAVHTMLAVDRGRFVSLIDPPGDAVAAARTCANEGTFPVLIGEADDVVLSSPIILYDHPAVAAESPGDLYDATEIDEILALRVLTLTEAEKAEARATDERAAAIVDRVERMPPAVWERLHGATRMVGTDSDEVAARSGDAPGVPWWDPTVDAAVDPWSDTLHLGEHQVGQGTRVRLRPASGGDAQDMFLAGLVGTVAGVFRDVDGGDHLAVTLDDDPANDLHEWQGRYRYFRPEEVEVLDPEATR